MQQLTSVGQNIVNDVSSRYNLSQDAVIHMLIAVSNGGGTMAQFNCPELGGGGQWMQGGMTMVGDMFNNGLKNTVNNLCSELSNALANNQMFPVAAKGTSGSNQWWPGDLGSPFSSGSQNNIRYAVFPNRLAVELYGNVTVYNTLDHNIGGVSQQQGSDTSLSFSSQYGTISVSSLPIVSGPGLAPAPQTNFVTPDSMHQSAPPLNQQQPNVNGGGYVDSNVSQPMAGTTQNNSSVSVTDIMNTIEKLSQLRDVGALTDDEFNSKKSELLSRV
jgi:hypothetical protein